MKQESLNQAALVNPSSSNTVFVSPQIQDIVCGRTKEAVGHSGNKELFRSLIAAHSERYKSTRSRIAKSKLANEIFHVLKEKNRSRFLRKDALGFWYEITDDAAKRKIGYALRDFSTNTTNTNTTKTKTNTMTHTHTYTAPTNRAASNTTAPELPTILSSITTNCMENTNTNNSNHVTHHHQNNHSNAFDYNSDDYHSYKEKDSGSDSTMSQDEHKNNKKKKATKSRMGNQHQQQHTQYHEQHSLPKIEITNITVATSYRSQPQGENGCHGQDSHDRCHSLSLSQSTEEDDFSIAWE